MKDSPGNTVSARHMSNGNVEKWDRQKGKHVDYLFEANSDSIRIKYLILTGYKAS